MVETRFVNRRGNININRFFAGPTSAKSLRVLFTPNPKSTKLPANKAAS